MAKAGAKFDEIVRARVPAALKREAEDLLEAMGLKVSDYMRMSLAALAREKRIPFNSKVRKEI